MLFIYLFIYIFPPFLRPRHRQKCWLAKPKGLDSSSLLLHHPSFSFWLHYPLNLLWSRICYRHPVNLTHCAPQQVSYALTDIRIRFKIIVWVTDVYHRVISIGGGGKVNLDNLNDCSQKINSVCRINFTHAALCFSELVGCLFHDVVSSSERTIKWNVAVIDELRNIMDAQWSGYCLISRINPVTAWRVWQKIQNHKLG